MAWTTSGKVVERHIRQDQGDWVIDYVVRHHGEVKPKEITGTVEGWLSNSSVPMHQRPMLSISRFPSNMIRTDTVDGLCSETLSIVVWDDAGFWQASPVVLGDNPLSGIWRLLGLGMPDLTQQVVWVESRIHIQVRLHHEHPVYGPYVPLLGVRSLRIDAGPLVIHDRLDCTVERYRAYPVETFKPVPRDRLDSTYYISAPDSVYLTSVVPGEQYLRIGEFPVRFNEPYRISFWHRIAVGSEGKLMMSISQYRDTPSGWTVLHGGAVEAEFTRQGRWYRYSRVITLEPETTSMALTFRFQSETDVGDCWIDDIEVVPTRQVRRGP